MKYFKHLLLLVFVLTLTGCKTTPFLEKLATPENLRFEDILYWDEVDNADGYLVVVNDTEFLTVDNFYVFETDGEYDVQIIATGEGFDNSDPTSVLHVSLIYADSIDINTRIEEDSIIWDEVEFANLYHVFINGIKHETTDNSFDISTYQSGVYSVYIQAIYPDSESSFSANLVFEYNLLTINTLQFQYSIHSTVDIDTFTQTSETGVYVQNSEGEFLNALDITNVINGEIYIKSSYITEQPIGIHSFYIIDGGVKRMIEITISDKETPYIISSSIIYTNGTNDITLQYELFEGTFYSINGTETDTVLFSVDGNILTIEQEFIDEKFESSDEFALSYVINVGEDSVIGYLFFNKPIPTD